MKKKGYSKGGMKKKGFSKGGAMKRKGGGSAMKKKGYAKGGSAKKMHLGGAMVQKATGTAVPASAGAARGTMVPASQTVSGAGLNPPQPAAQQQLDILSNSFSANKGAYTPTTPQTLAQASASKQAMQDVGMGIGDVGVGDFMNNQNPQRLDINLGQAPQCYSTAFSASSCSFITF
jgi:hypothetical protein